MEEGGGDGRSDVLEVTLIPFPRGGQDKVGEETRLKAGAVKASLIEPEEGQCSKISGAIRLQLGQLGKAGSWRVDGNKKMHQGN